MSLHAAASPSSASMWIECPASVTQAAGRTRPSSIWAKEGTAAHKVAEMIIKGDMFPPEKIVVEGETFNVGVDMLRHLNRYVGYVQQSMEAGDVVHVEQRVEIVPGLVWGTADAVVANQYVLTIADLKYGKGVPVDPDGPQLKIYAIGGLKLVYPLVPQTITLVIFQPRLDPEPKIVVLRHDELMEWAIKVLGPAVDRLQKNDPNEFAGPWCRWCVRQNECKAFSQQKAYAAAHVFDAIDAA